MERVQKHHTVVQSKAAIKLAGLMVVAVLSSFNAQAASFLTYQGRIVKPNGEALNSGNVTLTVQIRSPGSENCLMFQESHIVNMSNTDGVFSINIGNGTRSSAAIDGGLSLSQIFSNKSQALGPFPSCDFGTTYNPNAVDSRKMIVTFNDGSGVQTLQSQNMSFIPFAIESTQVGGYSPSQLLRVDGATTTALNASQYAELMSLLAGNSNQYTRDNELAGQPLPALSAGQILQWNGAGWVPTTPAAGTLVGDVTGSIGANTVARLQGQPVSATAPANGEILKWNGTAWAPAADSSGSVNSVTASAPLASSGGANPDISIAAGATTGQTLRWNGTNWVAAELNYKDLKNNSAASPWPTVSCAAGEFVTWSSVADAFACSALPDATVAAKGVVQVGAGLAVTSGVLSLPDVVTAGTYTKVTVDAKGRVTTGANLAPGDVTTALGYVPLNPANNLSDVASASSSRTNLGLGTSAVLDVPAAGDAAAGEVVKGDDSRLTDGRAPVGAAGGDLTGTYPNPTLTTTGVTPGAYSKVTVDDKGRVTLGASINSGDVTGALGYTPLNKAGDSMTGTLNMGGNDLIQVGNLALSSQKTFLLGTYNNAQETTLIGSLVLGDRGRTWYNSDTNEVKFWNGSAAVALGVSGAGLTNLNGLTVGTQTFAVPGTTGTQPNWSSVGSAHTLNIPLAATAGVTRGLISKVDYDNFNGKQDALGFVPLNPANNLSDVASAATSRFNLGLGSAATKDFGTAGGNLVELDGGGKIPASLLPNSVLTNATVAGGDLTGTYPNPTLVTTGVVAGTYTKVTVDAKGRVTSATTLDDTDLPIVPVAKGGTGLSTTPTNGQILIGDGSGYVLNTLTAGSGVTINNTAGNIEISAAGTGGTVTSVTSANADIGVANTTTTPVLTLNSGTGANQIVKLNGSSELPAVSGVNLTNLNASNLASGTVPDGRMPALTGDTTMTAGTTSTSVVAIRGTPVSATAPSAAGQVLRYNGTTQYVAAYLSPADIRSTVDSSAAFPSCTSSQVMTFNVPADKYECTTVNVAGALGYTPVNRAGDVMTGTLGLASYTNATEATLVGGLVAGDAGKSWYNSDTNQVKYWNGSAAIALGVAGAGLTNLNGSTVSTQSFATGTTGTDFNISTNAGAGTHTFNFPDASGTNRGLLTSADWTTFNNKLGAVAGSTLNDGQIWVGNGTNQATAVTPSGAVTISNAGVTSISDNAVTTNKINNGAVTNDKINDVAWGKITGTPTTLGGYGITDGVLNAGGTPSVQSGLDASKPAAGTAGRVYIATDTKKIYRDTGATWELIATTVADDLTGTLNVAQLPTVPVNKGGTGLTAAGTANQVLAVNTGGTALEYKSITAGSGVTVTPSAGGIEISATGSGGSVTSVGVSAPTGMSSTGGPITTSGTISLSWDSQTARTVLAAPQGAAGAPSFRLLNISDIRSSVAGDFLTGGACTAGQALTYSSVTDQVSCTSIVAAVSNNSTLADGKIWIGDATNKAQEITLSGAVTVSNAGVTSISDNAVTTNKINNGAVTNDKINDVAWGKITGTPTTLGGYGITDGVLNAGGTPSVQSGLDASKPAAGTAGRVYIATDTRVIYRDTGATWQSLGGSGDFLANGTVAMTGNLRLNNNWLSNDGGNEGLRVDNDGKVGVGTGSPQASFQVGAGADAPAQASTAAYVSNAGATNLSVRDSTSDVEYFTYVSGALGAVVGTYTNHDLTVRTNNTDRMVVMSTGNVAIGASSAATKLDVAGGVRIGDEAAACAVGLAGTFRYNGGNMQFCNGASWQTLGISGAGLTSLNGQTGSTQTFASPGTTGTAPNWSSAANAHTLHIPMANTAGVTAGLISKTEFDDFAAKIANAGGTPSIQSGVDASKPAFGTAGRLYVATDTKKIYRDTGVAWEIVATTVASDLTGTLATGQLPIVPLDKGGTNANLTAANGGVVYSTATAMGITSAGTAGQMLRSNGAAAPTWSTAVYPNTTTINQILYSSAANTVTGLATANDSFLRTDGSGVPSMAAISSDTFTQYALLAGRAGGQSLRGGTAANDNLTLDSTSNATKGYVLLNPSGGNVGIGVGTPATRLDVAGGVRLGDEAAACAAGLAGTFRYNGGNMQFCNGASWQTLGISGAGLTTFNGQTGSTQTLATPGTTGTAPNWSSAANAHTLHIPMANTAGVTAGLISKTEFDDFAAKIANAGGTPSIQSGVDASKPAAGTAGRIYIATDTRRFYRDTGAVWEIVGGGEVAGSALNSGQIWVGNGSNVAAAVTPSGDVTVSNAGAFTVTKIQGNTIASGVPTDGILTWNSTLTRWEAVNPPTCTTSQTMSWSAVTDSFSCSTVNVAGALGYTPVNKAGDAMTGALTMNAQNLLRFADSDSSNFVAFRAPAAVASDITWTLPAADGSSGQVLSTNGSGTLSWTTAGGSGDFLANGSVAMTGQFDALAGTAAAPGISFAADQNTGIFSAADDELGFSTAGAEQMRLDTSGNLMIGTNAAAATLHLFRSSGSNNILVERDGGATVLLQADGTRGQIGTQGAHSFSIFTDGGEQVTVTATGDVGIGQTAPNSKLHVNGSVQIEHDVTNCDNTKAGAMRWNGSNFQGCNGANWVTLDNVSSAGDFVHGYFVLTSTTYNGNMGGLSGANTNCLNALKSNFWMGKQEAAGRGLLVSTHVKAFLCDSVSCQGPLADTQYFFNRMGITAAEPPNGGEFFTSNSSSEGPLHSNYWDQPHYFDDTSTPLYWTGRAAGADVNKWSETPHANTCSNWSSTAGNGRHGEIVVENAIGTSRYDRWSRGDTTCNTARRLICFVHPQPYSLGTLQTQTFTYTGSDSSFVVPAGVTSITVKAWGAGGGSGGNDAAETGGAGGGGAFAQRYIVVTPGETLTIRVGGGGTAGASSAAGAAGGTGGFGGGANGGSSGTVNTSGAGGGGGGGTFILRGATVLAVAGGGGGGGGQGVGSASGSSGPGGGGGVAGSSVTSGGAGGTLGASGTDNGIAGTNRGAVDGGGGGGGGGGLLGGGGGGVGGTDRTGGGGAGGTNSGDTVLNGSGVTPGNSADGERAGAGNGGATGGNAGANGRLIIKYYQ